jgi:hypothetical protein
VPPPSTLRASTSCFGRVSLRSPFVMTLGADVVGRETQTGHMLLNSILNGCIP